MKLTAANLITAMRIPLSVGLLCVPALSAPFYAMYTAAGVTDMIDGTVARCTHQVTDFGAKLDTAADMVFAAASMAKLLPVLAPPAWLWAWTGSIATVKIASIARGFAAGKKLVSVHTVMNKIAGALLFLLPFSARSADIRLTGSIVCAAASAAALQEMHIVSSRCK